MSIKGLLLAEYQTKLTLAPDEETMEHLWPKHHKMFNMCDSQRRKNVS